MNSITRNTTSSNMYEEKARSTRERRRKQGKYPTVSQIAVARKLSGYGIKALSAAELETLSGHPYFSGGQRSEYAILAKQMREVAA